MMSDAAAGREDRGGGLGATGSEDPGPPARGPPGRAAALTWTPAIRLPVAQSLSGRGRARHLAAWIDQRALRLCRRGGVPSGLAFAG
jgi:hypothetical protein